MHEGRLALCFTTLRPSPHVNCRFSCMHAHFWVDKQDLHLARAIDVYKIPCFCVARGFLPFGALRAWSEEDFVCRGLRQPSHVLVWANILRNLKVSVNICCVMLAGCLVYGFSGAHVCGGCSCLRSVLGIHALFADFYLF